MALVIASSKLTYRVGDPDPPQLSVAGSSGNVHWTCAHGQCAPDDAIAGVYLSPENGSRYAAVGDPLVVTVHDLTTGEEASINLDIFATFPFPSDYEFDGEFDEDTIISTAEDGSETSFAGVFFATWSLPFNDREKNEFTQALAFRAFHGKSRFFYLDDGGLDLLAYGRFDSSLKGHPNWSDGVDYSFVFKCLKLAAPAVATPLSGVLPLYGETSYGDIPG